MTASERIREARERYEGGATITRAEYDALRRHDYAGPNPDGTVWVLYRSLQGTTLARNVKVV